MQPLLAAFECQATMVVAHAQRKGQLDPRRPKVTAGWQLPS